MLVCVCVQINAHTCGDLRLIFKVFLKHSSYSLKQILLFEPRATWLWLATLLNDCPVSAFEVMELQMDCQSHMAFTWVLGIRISVLTLVRQTLPLSRLLKPRMVL